MKKQFLIITILALPLLSIAGGPWPQPKGKGYFKLSEWWVVFNQHYTDVGLIDPNVTTGVFNTSFYGEYGITDRLTGIVNAPLFSRNYMNNVVSRTTEEILIPGEAINTLGDIDIALKWGLTGKQDKLPLSLTLLLGLPTGTVSGGTQGNLQTGDGEFNQLLQLDAGGGFKVGNIPAYFSAYVGVNNRTNGYSEELRFGGEVGFAFFDRKLWLASKLNVVESFKNGETAATITSTSLFANNTEFASLGVEANYYITKRIGVSAGYYGALRGEIIAAAPSYSVGVFYDLSK